MRNYRIRRSVSTGSGGGKAGTAVGHRTLTQGLVRRKATAGVAPDASAAVDTAAGSSGAALPAPLQEKFGGSLGTDLSSVRVHTDAPSQDAAASVGARAYTTGNDIHFGAGEYAPGTADGDKLIAHEVAHTVQQPEGGGDPQFKLEVSEPGDAAEVEADHAADAMVSGQPAQVSGHAPAIMREALPEGDNKTSMNKADEKDRQAVLVALDNWRETSQKYVNTVRLYLQRNWGEFLGRTTSAQLAWSGDLFHAIINKGVTFAVGKGAAPISTIIGGVGGPAGVIAGYAFGKVTELIVSSIVEQIAGKKPEDTSAADSAGATKDKIMAKNTKFDAEYSAGFDMLERDHKKIRQLVFDAESQEALSRIRSWCSAETSKVAMPYPFNMDLAERMVSDWALENTKDGSNSLGGIDQKHWKAGIGGDKLKHNKVLFAHQSRRHWATEEHLEGGGMFAEEMIAAEKVTRQFVFTKASDPAKFASAQLLKLTTKQFAYLAEGGEFTLLCEVGTGTDFEANDVVTNWSYQLTLGKTDFPDEGGKKPKSTISYSRIGPAFR